MSNLVFPSVLQGMDIKVDREPIDAVHVDEAESGRETRWTGSTYPRYRYQLDFNILRADSFLANAARNREWQQFCTHVARHFGRLSDFLWTDPDDSAVTDMGFAVGDGVTASFQLQRSMSGDLIDAAGFEYQAQTKPYANMVRNSSFETDTNADGLADSWAVRNNESATVPSFSTIVPGANGGKAQRVSWGTNSAGQHGIVTTTAPGYAAGQWYTVSFLARASGTNIGQVLSLIFDLPSPNQNLTITNPALTGSFQRYVFQLFWSLGTAPVSQLYLVSSASGTFGDLDFDEVLVVAGQYTAITLPQPNATPAAATAARTPAYWPGLGDGFEPVFDLNGDATIYEDGTWRGRRTLLPFTRTNLLPFSEQFDNAVWVKTNATITANSTTAPDGTATADTFNEGAAVTVVHNAAQNTTAAEVRGELRCYSIFVKASSLPNIRWEIATSGEGISFNLGAGVIDAVIGGALASGIITDPRWPGWFRIWFTKRVSATLGTGAVLAGCLDGTYAETYTGTSRVFFSWGAMSERVFSLNGPTAYIQTPSSAAVTVTDYSLSSSALFTPAAVPTAGTFYSWDGQFYRRCRLDMAGVPTSRLVQFMYEAKRIQLLSTKP